MTSLSIKGRTIAIIKKKEGYFAISNKCAHMECPLDRGKLEGYIVTCLCHDWRFDIRSGEFLDAREIRISTYKVKTEKGKIFLKMEGETE